MSNLIPTGITKCVDTGLETASFNYHTGIAYAKSKKLEQAGRFQAMAQGTHFIVCCGDVMVKVEATDFPEIERRSI